MNKQAAIATWKLSRTYLEAGAKLSAELKPLEHSMPAYFLLGHAIELAFKSYLIAQGSTENKLRKIGHDLEEAMGVAYSYETFDVFLSEQQKAVLSMLNPYYRGKELEYLVLGLKTFPDIAEVEATAHALVSGVEPRVNAAVFAHLKDLGK